MKLEKENILTTLSQSILFKDIEKYKIEQLIENSQKDFFKKGEIISEEELKNFIFIPLKGCVKSYQVNPNNGKAYTIFLFYKGDVFDIVTFIDQYKQSKHEVIFEVVKDVEFLKISHNILNKWIENEPQFNKNILFLLSHMLLSIEQNASDLALYDTFTRLSKLLVRHICHKSFSSDLKTKIKLKYINTLSHEEIADIIGTAREVVSRHIKVLKDKKILETNKKKYHILNLEALLEYCHIPSHTKKM